jgi:hypothetical protein
VLINTQSMFLNRFLTTNGYVQVLEIVSKRTSLARIPVRTGPAGRRAGNDRSSAGSDLS